MFLKTKSKAQTSVEFLIIFAVLFALFSFGVYIAIEKNSSVNEKEKIINAQNLGISLGNIINQVYQSNNGFVKTFLLRDAIDYNLSIKNYRLYVIDPKSNTYFDYPIYTNDVNLLNTKFNLIKVSKENNFIVIRDAE